MENNQNNNANERKHVSTTNTVYKNATAGVPSAMEVVYYDDTVKLAFTPVLPENQRAEKRLFDYDHQVVTMVRRNKANELYNAYIEKIVPALKEGRSEQVSVPIAEVNQLMIDTNVGEDGIPRPILKFIKNINPTTRIAADENVIFYEFNRGEYILGYNEKTGDFTQLVITYNELKLFMEDLHSMVSATSNAYCHTDRVINRHWKETLDDKLIKIGSANGIDLSYKANSQRASQGSIFDTKPTNKPVSSVITSLDQIEEELPFN